MMAASTISAVLLFAATASEPLYRYDAGAYTYSRESPLYRSYRDALPENLLTLLPAEAKVAQAYEKYSRAGSLAHGKASTHWTPLNALKEPTTAIDAAIARMRLIDFPDGDPPGGLAGAEWWFQSRAPSADIGFHYDKDEGTASTEWYMKMPILSTITYLTSFGAPTLIFNQSTNRAGNREVPAVPRSAALVYPRANRHVVFRGNLQHGVVGELGEAKGTTGSQGKRITFLVNWWDKAPIAPYCNAIDEATRDEWWVMGTEKKRLLSELASRGAPPSQARREQVRRLVDGGLRRGDEGRRVDVMTPPTRRINFVLPSALPRRRIYDVTWSDSKIWGGVQHMDLDRHHVRSGIFSSSLPVLIIFRALRDGTIIDESIAYSIARQFEGRLKVWTADAGACGSARERAHAALKH